MLLNLQWFDLLLNPLLLLYEHTLSIYIYFVINRFYHYYLFICYNVALISYYISVYNLSFIVFLENWLFSVGNKMKVVKII